MTEHKLGDRVTRVECSCGWVYMRPLFLDYFRTNRAIKRHLEKADS